METRRGGTYVMNNISFGAMMVSEQLRSVLITVSRAVAGAARVNSERSAQANSAPGAGDDDGQKLAESYEIERGPLVTLVVQGKASPRISQRVINRVRYAAAREFGIGSARPSTAGLKGKERKRVSQATAYGPARRVEGTRDLRRAGAAFGDLKGDPR